MTFADRVHHGQRQPVPSGLVAAPGVGAVVDQRALELVQQIAMGAVDFDGVEPCVDCPDGGGGKVGNDAVDCPPRSWLRVPHSRRTPTVPGPTVSQPPSDAGTEPRFPENGQYVEAFAAGVRQLGADLGVRRAVAVHKRRDPFPACRLLVVVDSGVQRADPSGCVDGCRLGEDQRRAAGGEGPRCIRCQSCGTPSPVSGPQLYWHMGDTQPRWRQRQ